MSNARAFKPRPLQDDQKRVLIVEDEPSMAHAMVRVLRGAGYYTEIAAERRTALSLMKTFRPSVMTLDLRLPNIGDGLSLLGSPLSWHRTELPAHCKVLIVSADAYTDSEQVRAMGAHGSLSKPFKNEVLLSEIDRLYAMSVAEAAAAMDAGT